MGCPESPLVTIVGDGALLLTEGELAAAAQHDLKIPMGVPHNVYRMIKVQQRSRGVLPYDPRIILKALSCLNKLRGTYPFDRHHYWRKLRALENTPVGRLFHESCVERPVGATHRQKERNKNRGIFVNMSKSTPHSQRKHLDCIPTPKMTTHPLSTDPSGQEKR